jgi:hypothetical protein
MAAGDLCKVSRKFYCHWFVEGYDNTAIHFSGTPTDKVAASVKVSPTVGLISPSTHHRF